MTRAIPDFTTPKPRETQYVRATTPVTVELHQPIAPGEVRTIAGRVLGAMHVDGQVHHIRFVDGDGVLFLVPPNWVRLTGEVIAASCRNSPPMRAEVLA